MRRRSVIIDRLQRLSASVYLLGRSLVGPLHRRLPVGTEDPAAESAPPLPAPWNERSQWYRDGTPPRQRNQITPLVHGDEFFADLYDTLMMATRRVTICGWTLTPYIPLLRGGKETESVLAEVLNEVSLRAEVYVLLWSGAPALFEPNTEHVRKTRQCLLEAAPRVRCELDTTASFGHCHHQKAITVDGAIAYVGGMDLTTFQGDRWDTSAHSLRFGPNWHDVSSRLRGEVVRDVESNFCERWNAVTNERVLPLDGCDIEPDWQTPAQIVRTIPAGFYPSKPSGEFGIRHALLAAVKSATRFIYLENQYIWAPEVKDTLIEAMDRSPSERFRIVLLLPEKAMSGRYDNDQHVRDLVEADAGRGIFRAFAPYSSGPAIGPTGYKYLPIYVHAKVGIVDDEWFSIGSANLNRRGLANDAEMNVQAVDTSTAKGLRVKLWAEHLGVDCDQVDSLDVADAVDRLWVAAADRMERSMKLGVGLPNSHVRRYTPELNLASRVLDRIQSMTLEY